MVLMGCFGAAEQCRERDTDRAHHSCCAGRQARQVLRWWRRWAQHHWCFLGTMRGTVLGPRREFVRGWSVAAGQQHAHFLKVRIEEMFGVVDPAFSSKSATARKHGPPHNPGGPNIAK